MKVKVIATMLLLLSLATNVMGQEGKYNLGRGYRAFVEIEEIGINLLGDYIDMGRITANVVRPMFFITYLLLSLYRPTHTCAFALPWIAGRCYG